MSSRLLALAALIALCAVPARAQQGVALRFQDGRVTLRADNAPVRTILAEWARLGGATIVNGERVVGPPVTIELTDVPERQALDVVLRNVAGYLLAPRRAGSQAASAFDRILILPTSVAPRNPPPAAAAARPRPVLPRPGAVLRQPAAQADMPDDLQSDGADTGADTPSQVPTNPVEPRPGLPPLMRRPPVPQGPPAEPLGADADPDQPAAPAPAVAPTPGNPFGVPSGSSATPGVIAPPPRATEPQQAQPNRVQ